MIVIYNTNILKTINLEEILNSAEGIRQGQLTGEEGERGQFTRQGRIQSAPLLQTQNFRLKNITEFLVVSGCVFYYLYIIHSPALKNNCFYFCK